MKKYCALLLLSAALACTSATPPAPKPVDSTVRVAIESRPDSAEVYVRGKFVGTTPMTVNLAAGDHPIEVRHPNRATWKRELTVLSNSPTRVMALLGSE